MQLTSSQVLSATGCSSLQEVKNINMWGKSLSDVSVVRQMPNVEVLSLSVNDISALLDFSFCQNLTELYLRKNKVSDLKQIRFLRELKNLRVLWMCSNPCAEKDIYRLYIIHYLPQLTKLDNSDISDEERKAAATLDIPPSLVLNLNERKQDQNHQEYPPISMEQKDVLQGRTEGEAFKGNGWIYTEYCKSSLLSTSRT
ncbi:hypothetical protein GEMRC1_013371 [Eukaryota sp. GEM-RC1]